jgi:hypothetical protein
MAKKRNDQRKKARPQQRRNLQAQDRSGRTPVRFSVGNLVRVKEGIQDPDYPDIPLGGWVGTVQEVDREAGQYYYLIAWSAETLNAIPAVILKRAERDGLTLEEMTLGEDDLEAYDGQPVVIKQPEQINTRPLSPDDQDDRIKLILGATGDDPVPDVDEETLLTYWRSLSQQLVLPFEAQYCPDDQPECEIAVIGLPDPEECECDEFYGLFCEARLGRRRIIVPLGEVRVGKGNPNHQAIEDYSYWFWNWR